MVYIQRIFRKEITIQIVGHTERYVEDVVQRIKSFATPVFYNCDTKIVEGKLMIETDKVQAKANISYYKEQLESLHREKNRTNSLQYREVIDSDIEKIKREICRYEKLL